MQTNHNIPANEREKKTRRIWDLRFVQVFQLILAGLFILGLLLPLRPAASDLEKRELAPFPAFTPGSLWDGSFFQDVSLWYADSYPFREGLLTVGSAIERTYGIHTQEIHGVAAGHGDEIPEAAKTPAPVRPAAGESSAAEASSQTGSAEPSPAEENVQDVQEGTDEADEAVQNEPQMAGTVYIVNNRGYEIYYFNRGGADAYASMMNTVRASLDGSVNVYDILAPMNFSVCLDEATQEALGGSSAGDAFAYIDSLLDSSIRQVPVLDTLVQHNTEYVYYNTDHHWTSLGAYYAYQQFCAVKGITPHSLSDFSEVAYDGFLGTFYSYSNQSDALANNPDTVYAYIPMGTNEETVTQADGSSFSLQVVNDMGESSAGSKYSCFIGGDFALTEIHNPAITDGSACVLIKESYGNAFAPFLVDHYQDVYVVDYRYYTGDLKAFITEKGIGDVIFLNNADALSEANSEMMLAMFR